MGHHDGGHLSPNYNQGIRKQRGSSSVGGGSENVLGVPSSCYNTVGVLSYIMMTKSDIEETNN